MGHPWHRGSTSKAHRPAFDKKELNKIFKGEQSAVRRNRQLKIPCGKPGAEEPGFGGGGRRRGRPFLAEGREVSGPPAGQPSSLGMTPPTDSDYSRNRILLTALCSEPTSSTDTQNPESAPSLLSLVCQELSVCLKIVLALLPSRAPVPLSGRLRPDRVAGDQHCWWVTHRTQRGS